MSRHYQNLLKEMASGMKGENGVIPLNLGRISEYLEISKGTMYTIGAETSGGKTAFALDQFMIHPMRWYHENKENCNIKLNIIYFCMERSHIMNTAKMMSKFIYEGSGHLVSAKRIVGRGTPLTENEIDKIAELEKYEDVITKDVLKVIEGSQTAESIEKHLLEYAREHGCEGTIIDDDGKMVRVWKPNHPNHITLILIDHIGLLGKEKSAIDHFSKIMRECKDFYKFSPVVLQQLNRDISQSGRVSPKSKPKLSDFEGSASTQQDSEVVIALYNAFTHLTVTENDQEELLDACDYNLMLLRNDYGIPCYRSIHLLKNTYGGAGLSAGLAFQPPTGSFLPMTHPHEISEYEYDLVTNGSIFITHKSTLF